MNPSTCIEFTLATPDATWSSYAPIVTLPPYLVCLLASGARGVAFVLATDVTLTCIVVPGSTLASAITVPTSALLDVVELPAALHEDEFGHAIRVARPPSAPDTRLVVNGSLEVTGCEVYGAALVEGLAAAYAKG